MRHITCLFVFTISLIAAAAVLPTAARAAGCARPVSTGSNPTASDCLFILRVSVGIGDCPVADCLCDADGSGATTATDALVCLRRAVGDTSIALVCCGSSTTTTLGSTTTSTLVVVTTTSTTTTTTVPVDGVNPMVRLTGGGCSETLEANGLTWVVPGDMAGEKSEYQPFPGELIGPFTWSSDNCGGTPTVDLVIPTIWRVGRVEGCRYALNALNGTSGVVSILSEFGSPECRPDLVAQ